MHLNDRAPAVDPARVSVDQKNDAAIAIVSRRRMTALTTLLATLICGLVSAAEPSDYLPAENFHSLYRGDMPAGVIGRSRLTHRGPVQNYFQPVKFVGPAGSRFSLPQGQAMGESSENLMAGLLIGGVYRFRITRIPEAEGAELYPTVELIDRMYPPPGLATSFPIPITVDQVDMEAALRGKMVTRVIYLEDPQTAIPLQQKPQEAVAMDIAEHQDPLRVADRLGRPVAILRIGSLTPPTEPTLVPQFYFGFPTWAPIFQPEPTVNQ